MKRKVKYPIVITEEEIYAEWKCDVCDEIHNHCDFLNNFTGIVISDESIDFYVDGQYHREDGAAIYQREELEGDEYDSYCLAGQFLPKAVYWKHMYATLKGTKKEAECMLGMLGVE
jgi:hypothetical protein